MSSIRAIGQKLPQIALLTVIAILPFMAVGFVGLFLDAIWIRYSRILMSGLLVAAIAGGIALRWRHPIVIALCAGVLAAIALCWLPPTSRGLFLDDLCSIRRGMTTSEVEARMKRYRMSGGGPELTFFHSDSHEYGGDYGTVVLRNGRVVRTEFSPD